MTGGKPQWTDRRNTAEWRKLCVKKDVQKAGKSGKK